MSRLSGGCHTPLEEAGSPGDMRGAFFLSSPLHFRGTCVRGINFGHPSPVAPGFLFPCVRLLWLGDYAYLEHLLSVANLSALYSRAFVYSLLLAYS